MREYPNWNAPKIWLKFWTLIGLHQTNQCWLLRMDVLGSWTWFWLPVILHFWIMNSKVGTFVFLLSFYQYQGFTVFSVKLSKEIIFLKSCLKFDLLAACFILVPCSSCPLTLEMEICASETSAGFHWPTHHCIPWEGTLNAKDLSS